MIFSPWLIPIHSPTHHCTKDAVAWNKTAAKRFRDPLASPAIVLQRRALRSYPPGTSDRFRGPVVWCVSGIGDGGFRAERTTRDLHINYTVQRPIKSRPVPFVIILGLEMELGFLGSATMCDLSSSSLSSGSDFRSARLPVLYNL